MVNMVRPAGAKGFVLAFCFAVLLAPCDCFARDEGFSTHVGAGTRSVPLGGAVFAGAGYDTRLWGDPSQGQFLYGYFRPAIETALAPSLFVIETKISFYPISFLGLTLGRTEAYRNTSTSLSVDCAELECGGRLRADFVTLNLALAAGGWVYLGESDWRNEYPERTRFAYYEDSVVLPGQRGGDQLLTHAHTIGRHVNINGLSGVFFGLNYKHSQMQGQQGSPGSGAFSDRYGVVAMAAWGVFRVSGVAGLYQSTWRGIQPTIGLSFDWVPQPGLAL